MLKSDKEIIANMEDELDAIYTEKDRMKERAGDFQNTLTTVSNWNRLYNNVPEFRAMIAPVQWAIAAAISNGEFSTDYKGIWLEIVQMTSDWGIDK